MNKPPYKKGYRIIKVGDEWMYEIAYTELER